MPSITLRNAYEAKRKIFTTNLNLDISQQLKKLDEKEKKKPRALTQRQQETLDMLKDGYTLSRIAEEGNMSRQTAYNQLKSLRERGMSIVPIRTKGQKEPSYEVIE
jgi:DNA-binding NarL/FixJ family response regulator